MAAGRDGFGGPAEERIQFNEDTLWTGEPHEYQHEGAARFLPQIRQLLQEMRRLERDALQFDLERSSTEAQAKLKEARTKQRRRRTWRCKSS